MRLLWSGGISRVHSLPFPPSETSQSHGHSKQCAVCPSCAMQVLGEGLCHILQFPDGAMTAIPDQAVVGKEHKWSLSEDVCVCVCAHACSQLLISCETLCNPMDWSPSGSPVHGILWGIFLNQGSKPHLRHWAGEFFTTRTTQTRGGTHTFAQKKPQKTSKKTRHRGASK